MIMLNERVALITGGSRGIGKSGALALGKEGAKIVIAARALDQSNEVVNELKKMGCEASAIRVDVGNLGEVQSMVKEVFHRYGRIDILINNAGATDDAFIDKMSYQQWESIIDTNLNGTFYCIKEVIPYMFLRGFGRIINVASVAAQKGAVAQSNYAASKAGLIGLTLSLAQELGSKGITVNAVSPGYISTTMVDQIPEKIKKRAIEKIPLGRFGTPGDIANAFLFLVNNAYCNGTILDVNGGISI